MARSSHPHSPALTMNGTPRQAPAVGVFFILASRRPRLASARAPGGHSQVRPLAVGQLSALPPSHSEHVRSDALPLKPVRTMPTGYFKMPLWAWPNTKVPALNTRSNFTTRRSGQSRGRKAKAHRPATRKSGRRWIARDVSGRLMRRGRSGRRRGRQQHCMAGSVRRGVDGGRSLQLVRTNPAPSLV
jgi:hypothetical protein